MTIWEAYLSDGGKMKKCELENCDNPLHARGLCNKHYRRVLLHNDASVVKRHNTYGMSLPEKIEYYTDKTGDCWVWIGSKDRDGYGNVHWRGETKQAHRMAWFVANGDIPNGIFVLHKCDNPSCVNPNHLFLGTHQDNMDDMKKKGRSAVGVGKMLPPCTKLCEDEVLTMRGLYSTGLYTQASIASLFGVSRSTAQYAINGKTWKHI